MNERIDNRAEPWPLRPWLMAAIGTAAGLLFYLATKPIYGTTPLAVWRQAAATFVAVATVSFILTVERRRWSWSLAFAIAWGAVIALVGWFTARYNFNPTIFEWPYLSGLLAVMLAAPLFQTVRDEGRRALPYERLHNHAWADAVIGAASLAFTGIVFLLAFLIAGLFDLIGIEQVRKLLDKQWFDWMLAGFAFGAAIGLLRERDRLLPMLQRLVRIVLEVLAPPLAVALVLFLASIPFTGLQKFWKSGVPATPLLLLAGAGAILLANTVFAEDSNSRSPNPILRGSSLLLVAVVLPLAAIAALSLGIRIDQYGWTPERIWGVIAVAVAVAYGLAGWCAIWRGRKEFDEPLRPLQTQLALGLCGLALFLALPIVDFGAISARSQIDRLESGRVKSAEFDWAAMAFKYGPSGRSKLQRIAETGPVDMRSMAAGALKANGEWSATQDKLAAGPPPTEISVLPASVVIPKDLSDLLLKGSKGEDAFCSEGGACRVYIQPDSSTYIVFMDGCANLPAASRNDPKTQCTRTPGVFERQNGKWTNVYTSGMAIETMSNAEEAASLSQETDALARGDVRLVTVQKRQLMVGGKLKGDAF
jgi:hypothetical protein